MEISELIAAEEKRQSQTLTLIPSENYASQAVRSAEGSVLSAKYSEGYPGKRYYQGNKIIDEIENIAINSAKELFGVPHANVQPYSGSPANASASAHPDIKEQAYEIAEILRKNNLPIFRHLQIKNR